MTKEKMDDYIVKIKKSIERKREIEARMDAHLKALADERERTGKISIFAN